MKRQELLSSPEYWTVKIQAQLLEEIHNKLESSGQTQSELAKELNVSRGYISQILNGDYDHRISKFVELSLAIGKVPIINFRNLSDVIREDLSAPGHHRLTVIEGGLKLGNSQSTQSCKVSKTLSTEEYATATAECAY